MWFFYTKPPWAASCGEPGDGSAQALGLLISGSGPIGHGSHNTAAILLPHSLKISLCVINTNFFLSDFIKKKLLTIQFWKFDPPYIFYLIFIKNVLVFFT